MSKYFEIYERALARYKAFGRITHHSIPNSQQYPSYEQGWFSKLRHSRKEYPALQVLRQAITNANNDEARDSIIHHFSDEQNKWNNHSFNSYFLDELYRDRNTNEEWDKIWSNFDPRPIVYYHGHLFRGIGVEPTWAFQNGLKANNHSPNLTLYITNMPGSIGVSTTKDFAIAASYALPRPHLGNEYETTWDSSYIYVINYGGGNLVLIWSLP